MDWIKENMEWLFSGIGITVILGVIGFIKKKNNNNPSIKQVSKNNSIQIINKNGSINLNNNSKRED